MSAVLLDIDENFKDIYTSVGKVQTGLAGLSKEYSTQKTGLKVLGKQVQLFGKEVKVAEGLLVKLGATSKLLQGVAFGLFSVVDVGFSAVAAVKISEEVYRGWKELKATSKTLDFSEAITGSTELKDNLEMLEQTSDIVFDGISKSIEVLFDNAKFNEFSSRAVAAYAPIEQAAYRLGTITVAANERSIDSIDRNIASMRELQEATNNTVDSVSILNAQYDIASAGFGDAQASEDVGTASINLSQAGFGGVEGSTNAIVRALRALGDESSNAELRAAQLFETTKVGLLTLDQLTPEVGGLAVQSTQLGLDFEELLGTLAGLTTQGISTAEAGTRISSFLSDIAAGSAEANLYLSQFRDEAGKPIQINAQVLKDKGIAGIIEDLQKATGGRVENLQKVFTNQMSIEAVQLLSSLGSDALEDYSERIGNASGEKLESEAEGRTQTVTGAFEQARIASSRGVEEFGQGNAQSVIEGIASTNDVFRELSTGSAKTIGEITGGLQKVHTIITAVSSTVGAVFSIAAPIVMFGIVLRNLNKVGSLLKFIGKVAKEPWKAFEQVAVKAFTTIEAKAQTMIAKLSAGFESLKTKVREALNPPVQGELFDLNQYQSASPTQNLPEQPQNALQAASNAGGDQLSLFNTDTMMPDRFDGLETNTTSMGSSVEERNAFREAQNRRLEAAQSSVMEKDNYFQRRGRILRNTGRSIASGVNTAGTNVVQGIRNAPSNFRNLASNQRQLFQRGGATAVLNQRIGGGLADSLGNLSKTAGGGKLKGMLSGIGKGASAMGASFASAMAPLAGIMLAFTMLSEWSKTLSAIIDKKNNPAVAALGETISGLNSEVVESIPVLNQMQGELSGLRSASEEAASGMESMFANIGSRAKYAWGFWTGGLLRQQQVNEETERALSAIDSQISNSLTTRDYQAVTIAGMEAQQDVESGQIIDADDEQALQEDLTARIQLLRSTETILRNQMEAARSNGDTLLADSLEAQLAQRREENNRLEETMTTQLNRTLGQNALNRYMELDTSVELSVAIPQQNEEAIRSQLNDLGESVSEVFGGDIVDPASLYELAPEIEGALSSIQTQVELDPQSANTLLQDLRSTVEAAGGDFDRVLASEPKLRELYSQVLQASTQAAANQLTNIEKTETSVLEAFQASGLIAGGNFSSRIYESIRNSIDGQIELYETELNDSATSEGRKIELRSKLAELNAQRLSKSLEGASAVVEAEYAQRNKLIERGNQLADSLNNLANSSLLAGSSVGTFLAGLSVQTKADTDSIQTNAQQEIDAITARLGELTALAGGDGELANEARSQLGTARRQAREDIESIQVNAALAEIAQSLSLAEASVNTEYASRDRLTSMSEELSSSFSNLSSSASGLFSNSSLGATLNKFATELQAGTGKAQTEYEKELRLLEERNRAVNEAVTRAREEGADRDIISSLEEAADIDNIQRPLEEAYLRQELVVSSLNERLSIMSAEVQETTDVIQKQADIFKSALDLEARRIDLVSETNSTRSNLQGSILGFFGENNPFAAQLQQRLDAQSSRDSATSEQAGNVIEAQKETIDLTLQKAQLTLEQQSYENALTQTQLLSDLVSVSQGGEATFANSNAVQERLNQLPQAIQQSQQFAAQRLSLVDEQLGFVEQELTQRNANVEANMYAEQLGMLSSGGINGANMDLIQEALGGASGYLGQTDRQEIEVGSLRDADFQRQIATINSMYRGGNQSPTESANIAQASNSRNSQQNTTINAPVTVSLDVTGAEAQQVNSNLQQGLQNYVGQEINRAIGQLGRDLLQNTAKV